MQGIYENVMLSTSQRVTFLISILHIHTTYFFLGTESSVIYALSVSCNLMFAVDHKICRSFNVSYNSCFFSSLFSYLYYNLTFKHLESMNTLISKKNVIPNKFVYIIHVFLR